MLSSKSTPLVKTDGYLKFGSCFSNVFEFTLLVRGALEVTFKIPPCDYDAEAKNRLGKLVSTVPSLPVSVLKSQVHLTLAIICQCIMTFTWPEADNFTAGFHFWHSFGGSTLNAMKFYSPRWRSAIVSQTFCYQHGYQADYDNDWQLEYCDLCSGLTKISKRGGT